MIKGNNGNRGSSSSGYSADLLVCFPSRAHLALTPKPICSPSRPSDSSTNRRPHHRRQLSKLSGGGHASPVLWAKQASSKNMGGDEIAEPTSPKVTCAGQIKARPSKCGGGRGKNWQSVMEEIERIHSNRTQSKFFGLKKDVMGFLTCLRNIRFDFRCFGDFRHADVTSDDEEEDDDDEEEEGEGEEEESSKTVFSKWFMVLQEEQSNNDDEKSNNNKCVVVDGDEKRDHENADAEPAVPPPNALLLMRCRSAPAKSWLEERMKVKTEQDNREEQQQVEKEEEETEGQDMSMKTKSNNKCVVVDGDEKRDHENADVEPAAPPPNALLLMRCRSAPAKSWLEERMKVKTDQDNREEKQEEEEEETEDQEMSMKKKKDLRSLMEEEKMELVLMRYDTEFYRLSSDIAKETWVVGGIQDPLSRSRSWKS